MTPHAMAALYARAFPDSRAWTETELAQLASPPGFAVHVEAGFALGRAVAGEAELITIAVDPDARRNGLGRVLLAAFEAEATARGATSAFLEVHERNAPARALYRAAGWAEAGRRRGYYVHRDGPADAVTMSKPLA